MHLALLTDTPQKGNFIIQGLRYENLSTDLLSTVDFTPSAQQSLLHYDGVFLYFDDQSALFKLLEGILKNFPHVPIVVLVHTLEPRLLQLYDQGLIRRFFVRPFPFRLMAAEMRSLIFNEREKIRESTLKIRHLELDRDAHEIRISGQTVYLRAKEFALLEFLMMNAGKVLSRGTILENVWDRNANIFTNTVDVHINQLRKKIEMDSAQPFIKTVPCSGYLFS